MKNLWVRIWEELILVFAAGFSWMFFIFGGLVSMTLIFLWGLHVWGIYTIRIYPMVSFNSFFHLARMEIFLAMVLVGFLGVYFLDWKKRILS